MSKAPTSQLKYCEFCGALRLRDAADAQSICPRCRELLGNPDETAIRKPGRPRRRE